MFLKGSQISKVNLEVKWEGRKWATSNALLHCHLSTDVRLVMNVHLDYCIRGDLEEPAGYFPLFLGGWHIVAA
jgi:hypothetical protein